MIFIKSNLINFLENYFFQFKTRLFNKWLNFIELFYYADFQKLLILLFNEKYLSYTRNKEKKEISS